MSRYLFILICCTPLISSFVVENEKVAAGIFPYAVRNDGTVQLLLGREKAPRQYWADFIGGYKTVDGTDPKNTAAREANEETSCKYGYEYFLERLEDANPMVLNSTTYRYIIEVDYKDPIEFRSANFPCEYVEKIDWAWVDLEVFLQAIDNAPDDKNVALPLHFGEPRKLDKKMRKGLVRGTPSRDFLDALVKKHSQKK